MISFFDGLFFKEDIIYLNITNELHHLSIKRSIQVLRLNKFNSTCIKRRPSSQDKNDINEIMYWSNHRIMEWLRSIDLSEYAPHLRGSGVCGALIVRIISFFLYIKDTKIIHTILFFSMISLFIIEDLLD